MKNKPIRTCIGCRQEHNKSDMLRIVKNNDDVKIDFSGKLNGRGAYLCKNVECLNKAIKNKKLDVALKMEVGEDIIKNLYREIENDR